MEDIIGLQMYIPINIGHLARIVSSAKLDAGDLLQYARVFLKNSDSDEAAELSEQLEKYTIDEIRSSLMLSILHHAIVNNDPDQPTFLCEFKLDGISPIENYSFKSLGKS
jgi:hypothetical protein